MQLECTIRRNRPWSLAGSRGRGAWPGRSSGSGDAPTQNDAGTSDPGFDAGPGPVILDGDAGDGDSDGDAPTVCACATPSSDAPGFALAAFALVALLRTRRR